MAYALAAALLRSSDQNKRPFAVSILESLGAGLRQEAGETVADLSTAASLTIFVDSLWSCWASTRLHPPHGRHM